MNIIKKILKMTTFLILGIIALLVIGTSLFVWLSPEFGGSMNTEHKQVYSQSPQWQEDKFVNAIPTNMDIGLKDMPGLIIKQFKSDPARQPKKDIPVIKIDSLDIAHRSDTITQLTWFGHSAFLLEIKGKKILIDPMFGPTPAPHPTLGKKRYNSEMPIKIEKLPKIDAILLSHDHYDHLDYGSIMKLKSKTREYFVPLGVGRHLESWGIEKEKIHELDWWEFAEFEELQLTCSPARHFSGRGITDRATTLWCSWAIKSDDKNLFFSGDSGYGPHFKEIGEKLGPFDFAMLECGQYNEQWSAIHMIPEESAQAGRDVQADMVMPIHWGSFTLAFHSWTDPVERFTKAAAEHNMKFTTPRIGEAIVMGKPASTNNWWEELQ
ncbi:MAG: MBL fold metallo-hydrolase [Bacteroidia bacterium]